MSLCSSVLLPMRHHRPPRDAIGSESWALASAIAPLGLAMSGLPGGGPIKHLSGLGVEVAVYPWVLELLSSKEGPGGSPD